jgi:hypothetical protein
MLLGRHRPLVTEPTVTLQFNLRPEATELLLRHLIDSPSFCGLFPALWPLATLF